MGEKVKGTFLMRLDGILIHVIEISQYYNIGRSKIIQNHTIGVLLNSSIKVHVHVHVCLVMHIMYSTCRVVCDLFQLQLTSDLTPIFADGSPSFVVPTSAIIPYSKLLYGMFKCTCTRLAIKLLYQSKCTLLRVHVLCIHTIIAHLWQPLLGSLSVT